MKKITWKKIPSVTPGGKPFFYHGDAIGSSIVWNRGDCKYHATLFGQEIGSFDWLPDAKKAVQQKFEDSN